MAITSQKGAPNADNVTQGKFSLVRIHLCEASVPTPLPVVPVEIEGIQDWSGGQPSPEVEEKVYHQGGGMNYAWKRFNYTTQLTITFLNGYVFSELEKFLGLTFESGTTAGMPLIPKDNSYPQFHFEGVIRQDDNTTHLGSYVLPDCVMEPVAWDNPLDGGDITVTFTSQKVPILIPSGTQLIYDLFTGDGSTTDFTLSATPLDFVTASNYRDFAYDDLIYVKEKASTADTGTEQTTGWEVSTVTLTATTAPAASTVVQVPYIAVT